MNVALYCFKIENYDFITKSDEFFCVWQVIYGKTNRKRGWKIIFRQVFFLSWQCKSIKFVKSFPLNSLQRLVLSEVFHQPLILGRSWNLWNWECTFLEKPMTTGFGQYARRTSVEYCDRILQLTWFSKRLAFTLQEIEVKVFPCCWFPYI